MAARHQPATRFTDRSRSCLIAATLLAVGLFGVVIAALAALLQAGENDFIAHLGRPSVWQIALFTGWQALLSTLLSLAVALPVARACWRRAQQWRSGWLVAWSIIALVMPTTVAATGLLAVWGQNGFVSTLLVLGGFERLPPVYGLPAVLLAHVFLNAPLMLRVLTSTLAGTPAAQWRLSAQWGLSAWQRFVLLEWPAMRRVVPGLLSLVFLLCFTSFALVLMLGGGPAVTTLEVSIYTALRFEFDLPRAATLSLLQLGVCALIVFALSFYGAQGGPSWVANPLPSAAAIAQRGERRWRAQAGDLLLLGLFALFITTPILAVLLNGASHHLPTVLRSGVFWRALSASLLIALGSAVLATGAALLLAAARVRLAAHRAPATTRPLSGLLDAVVSLYLAVPAIVLGTGAFILLRRFADLFVLAPLLVLTANVLLSLPFAYRVLEGRMAALAARHDMLCAAFGIRGWRRFIRITAPAMAPEIGFAAGLSAAFSLGDLGVIALFGSQQFQTLPWLLYQTMNRYRAGEAAALALLLLGVTFLLLWGWGRLLRLMQPRRRLC